MSKLLLPLVLAFTCPVGVVAQAALSPCTPPGLSGAQSLAIDRIGIGSPYTLTAIIKADGVSSKGDKTTGGVTTSLQARDSQGRTRIDHPAGCFLADGEPRWLGTVTVNDPVANTVTSWFVAPALPRHVEPNMSMQAGFVMPKKIAAVKNGALKEVEPRTGQEEFDSARRLSQSSDHDPDAKRHIQYKVEDLGKRTIAGLEASGMRITQTFPANFLKPDAAGLLTATPQPFTVAKETRSFTVVEEKWISDQYQFILLDIVNSEVNGMSSYEVTNFTPGEPAPSLFQPPPDYGIDNLPAK